VGQAFVFEQRRETVAFKPRRRRKVGSKKRRIRRMRKKLRT
jgi:hypothetical protein